MVRIEIPGRPARKDGIATNRHGHPYGKRYEMAKVYAELCALNGRLAMQGKPPIEGACEAWLQITFQKPRSWPRKRHERFEHHTTYPDVDRSCVAILDGLKGIVFCDDRQVTDLHVSKRYGRADKVVVQVQALEVE